MNRPFQHNSIDYFESGSGDCVVFVHGSASDHRSWHQQLDPFARSFRVVTYSRRFHWPNEPATDDSEYAMSDQVGDLVQLLESLDCGPVHLIGHSYGAYLALIVAFSRPALVSRLVLAEAPVIPLFTGFPPRPHEILKLLVVRPRTALAIIKFAATGLGPATLAAKKDDMTAAVTSFGKAVLGNHAFEKLSASRFEQALVNSSKAELLSESFMTPLQAADVKSIRAQTLLVTGQQSPLLFHRLTDRLEALIPNTERLEIPSASHMMHEDNANAFNQGVLAFLGKPPHPN